MKSTRLKYAVQICRYHLSDRLNINNRCQIVTRGSWIASGSARQKTVGNWGAKALIVICLLSGTDHIKGVAKFILVLQVFSSFSGRFSLIVCREGLTNNYQLFSSFCKCNKASFLLTFQSSFIPSSLLCTGVPEKCLFQLYCHYCWWPGAKDKLKRGSDSDLFDFTILLYLLPFSFNGAGLHYSFCSPGDN